MNCFSKKKDKKEKKKSEDVVYDPQRIYFDEFGNLIYDQDADRPNREEELRKILMLEPGDDSIHGATWYIMDAPWVEAWLYYAAKEKNAPRPGPCYNHRLIQWFVPEVVPAEAVVDNNLTTPAFDPLSSSPIIVPNNTTTSSSPSPAPTPVIRNSLVQSQMFVFPGQVSPPQLTPTSKDSFSEARWICRPLLAMATESRVGDYRRVTPETWFAFKDMYPLSGPAITTEFIPNKLYAESGYYPTDNFKILDPPTIQNVTETKRWFSISKSVAATAEFNNNIKDKKNASQKDNNNNVKPLTNSVTREIVHDLSREQRVTSDPNMVFTPLLTADSLQQHDSNQAHLAAEQKDIQEFRHNILNRKGNDSDDDKDSDDDQSKPQ